MSGNSKYVSGVKYASGTNQEEKTLFGVSETYNFVVLEMNNNVSPWYLSECWFISLLEAVKTLKKAS